MKIRYPVIVFIALNIIIIITSGIDFPLEMASKELMLDNILGILWLINLLWVAYAVIAAICRSIYRAVKNKNSAPKSPLEP